MGKNNRSRREKKKRREKKLRRERNVRHNGPQRVGGVDEDFDIQAAVEALPASVSVERVMRRLVKAAGRHAITDAADIEAWMSTFDEATRAKLREEDPRETAQDFAFLAREELDRDVALDFLEEALDLDPENAEALCHLAVLELELGPEQIREIEHALSLAERDLREPLQSAFESGDVWSDVLSRPYMRIRRTLANVYESLEKFPESMHHCEALLALDASDPLEARQSTIAALLALGHRERAAEQIDLLPRDQAAFAAWARVLQRWLESERTGAVQALREARSLNALAEDRILQPIQFGEEENDGLFDDQVFFEATGIGLRLSRAWAAHRDALDWLEEGAPSSAPIEREAAMRSFPSPIAALFTLGAPDFSHDPADRARELGLTTTDIPELVRLAAHPALNEIHEEPQCWAPMHACRLLGELEAESAVRPLLDLLLEQGGDPRWTYELPEVISRIGEPAVPELLKFLRDFPDNTAASGTAIESLGMLAAQHPAVRPSLIEVLERELARHEEKDNVLNGVLVTASIDARAVELIPAIRAAFEAGTVDEVIGSFEEVEAALVEKSASD
jgi:tetratricopeptide (TPR) repeat protein